jgi:hypothetical protein
MCTLSTNTYFRTTNLAQSFIFFIQCIVDSYTLFTQTLLLVPAPPNPKVSILLNPALNTKPALFSTLTHDLKLHGHR